jgi:hypothetical protein
MPLAHIAGVPVEESLLALAPLGAAGLGAIVATASHRARRWRPHRRRRPPATRGSAARPAPRD